MRVPVDFRSASKENYIDFCKNNPKINLTYEKWSAIIYGFNIMFRDYVLETGDKVKYPYGIGDFSILKKKTRRTFKEHIILPIDWVKTKQQGKRVYSFNPHTEGFRFKWYWFVKKSRLKHSKFWIFKPSRVTSRELAKYLKKPNSDYQYIYREWNN